MNQNRNNNIDDLKAIASLMDSKFRGPFGFRFGLDGVIGLIPGIGDFLTNLVSIYIMARVSMMNYPTSIVFRMGLNLLFENIVDAIPFIGNIFDFFWKANTRNLKLVESYEINPQQATRRSLALNVLVVATVLILMLTIVIVSAVIAFKIIAWLFSLGN